MKEEVWKEIKGYEDYEISNHGRVKSLKYNKERILKPTTNRLGYYYVVLSSNKIEKSRTIHQMVAEAFCDHIPNGFKCVVNHKDNNRANNYYENLESKTQRENANKKHLKTSSKYTGVCWDKERKLWRADIYIKPKLISLGRFEDELEASEMYELALKNLELFDGDMKKFREKIKKK